LIGEHATAFFNYLGTIDPVLWIGSQSIVEDENVCRARRKKPRVIDGEYIRRIGYPFESSRGDVN
jgi:hypothetical protein